MLSKEFITIFNRKPSKMGKDYYFKISRDVIREGIIDPKRMYELRIFNFDDKKE